MECIPKIREKKRMSVKKFPDVSKFSLTSNVIPDCTRYSWFSRLLRTRIQCHSVSSGGRAISNDGVIRVCNTAHMSDKWPVNIRLVGKS